MLLSQSTRDLIDADVSDLGLHRLKDLLAAEHVYQLGRDEFPPLKSLYQTNLPIPATPFLGRERELGEVTALLARDAIRLLTLTGPGGTGKTRLALQAAAELQELYPDGVYWVGLAPLRDPHLVLSTIARAWPFVGPVATSEGSFIRSRTSRSQTSMRVDRKKRSPPYASCSQSPSGWASRRRWLQAF